MNKVLIWSVNTKHTLAISQYLQTNKKGGNQYPRPKQNSERQLVKTQNVRNTRETLKKSVKT